MTRPTTCSGWLNRVGIWFAKIERDVISRGVFTSKADLKRKLMRFISNHNESAKPIKWSYSNPSRRITAIVVLHATSSRSTQRTAARRRLPSSDRHDMSSSRTIELASG